MASLPLTEIQLEEMTQQVLEAERTLTQAAEAYGKGSPLYKECLKKFAVSWFTLKMSREQDSFLKELSI